MDALNLKLDHDNELLFKVMIEGTREADTQCRLMVERDEYSYAFPGEIQESGEVVVIIPALEKAMKEGTYDAKLEVIVDDRVFEPLKFHAEFTKSVKVTAESVTRRRTRKVSASAEIISSAPKIKRKQKKGIRTDREIEGLRLSIGLGTIRNLCSDLLSEGRSLKKEKTRRKKQSKKASEIHNCQTAFSE